MSKKLSGCLFFGGSCLITLITLSPAIVIVVIVILALLRG